MNCFSLRSHIRKSAVIVVMLLSIMDWSGAAHAQTTGAIQYDTAVNRIKFYDGTGWFNWSLGIALGGCTKEGEMEFDKVLSVYKYCNGTSWIRIIGTPTFMGCSKRAALDYISGAYHYCNGLLWMNLKGAATVAP